MTAVGRLLARRKVGADQPRRDARPSAELAAVALAVLVAGVALVGALTDADPRLASTNTKVIVSEAAITVGPGEERCQGGEFVPRETSSLLVYSGTLDGRPGGEPLVVSLREQGGRVAASSEVPGGYRPGKLKVAVPGLGRDLAPGTFCLRNVGAHPMLFADNVAQPARNGPGARPEGEIRVDYYRPGQESWLDLAPEVARRFSLFKPGFVGPWTMWAVLALAVLLGAGGVLVFLRSCHQAASRPEGRRGPLGLPLAGWACAGIAIVNAGAWALVTPSFQVIDEPRHAGYADYIARTGSLPRYQPRFDPGLRAGSAEYEAVLDFLPFSLEGRPTWSAAQDRELRREMERRPSRASPRDAGPSANYSPVYYAYEAIPARLSARLSLLDRLFAMRLGSALLGGVTVAFVFLFLREVLPSTPWAWALGSLAAAFQPLFAHLAGGVNNDNLLFTAGAVVLYLLARGFRHGMTPRLGGALGAATAIGILAKPTMVAVVPAVGFGMAAIAWRAPSDERRKSVAGGVAGLAVMGVLLLGWFAAEIVLFDRSPTAPVGDVTSSAVGSAISVRGQLSYLWQFFLPRLPFMDRQFTTYPTYPVWDIYVQGFIGRFGWFQYGFPGWVNKAGLVVLAALSGLAGVELVRKRSEVRRRWPELACYALIVGSLVLMSGVFGYRFRAVTAFNFEQPRYLFPALALYGALVALAARGAGRRWATAVAAFLVTLVAAHSLFAMLVTIERYYT